MFSSISCEECTLLLPNLQALVAEMVGNFGKRLEPYGVKVGHSYSSSTAPRARPPVHSSPNSLPLHAAAFPQECHATCCLVPQRRLSPLGLAWPMSAGARAHGRHEPDEAGD